MCPICSVSGQFYRIALQLHDQDGVRDPLGGRRSFTNPVHRVVTDGAPLKSHVRREPASCSGFNLSLIAAYSYIVNPRSRIRPSGFATDTGAETPKCAAGFFFIGTPSLHLKDCAKSSPSIRPTGSAYRGAPAVQEKGRRLGGGSESDPIRSRVEKKHGALQQRVVDSRIGTYGTLAITGSFRLDAAELDHLGPLLGVVGDQFFELNRRAGEPRAA